MSKSGWDKNAIARTLEESSQAISRDELELYDRMRNMMYLCLLAFSVLVIVGKLGLRSAHKEKAKKA